VVEQRFLETMKAIQGALIVSSSIQIILGYSQLWGIFSRSLSFTLRSFLPRAIPNLPIYYQVVPFQF
jgi:hypothetical protein